MELYYRDKLYITEEENINIEDNIQAFINNHKQQINDNNLKDGIISLIQDPSTDINNDFQSKEPQTLEDIQKMIEELKNEKNTVETSALNVGIETSKKIQKKIEELELKKQQLQNQQQKNNNENNI